MLRKFLAATTVALLAGCAGGSGSSPGGSVTPLQNAVRPAAHSTIPGQYKGTGIDSKFGTADGSANLSQAGPAVGGDLNFKYVPKHADGSAVFHVRNQQLNGVWSATLGPATCTFTVMATYDSSAYTLDGTYSAKRGCAGESGTFTFKEVCYYVDASRSRAIESARPAAGGLRPC